MVQPTECPCRSSAINVPPPRQDQLRAVLSRTTARLVREFLDRRPTAVETVIRGETVVILTKLSGDAPTGALDERKDQVAANERRSRFVEALLHEIETITERRVVSLLGDHDPESDRGVQVFVLESPLDE